jgi:hypothetical protein
MEKWIPFVGQITIILQIWLYAKRHAEYEQRLHMTARREEKKEKAETAVIKLADYILPILFNIIYIISKLKNDLCGIFRPPSRSTRNKFGSMCGRVQRLERGLEKICFGVYFFSLL